MGSKRRKWPYILGGIILVGVLAYPIAGNILLYSGALERIISKKPGKLKVTWSSAWTLWPGEIKVADFRLDIHTKKNRIQVDMGNAAIQLNLLALTEKTVDIPTADVDGLMVSHTKLPKDEIIYSATTETTGKVEPSADAGTQNEPVNDPGTAKPKKRPWIIDLKGISAKNVEQVQFNQLKLTGNGALSEFGMRLVTKGGPLRIDTLKLDMEIDVSSDPDDTDPKTSRLTADIRMAENIPKQNKGRKLLKFISGRAEVSGDANGIAFISALLGNKFNLSVSGGGRLDLLAIVESGELMDGSRINFNSDLLATEFTDLQARGVGEITGAVDSTQEIPVSFRIRVQDFTLNRQNVPNPYMEGADLSVELAAQRFFLHQDMEQGQLYVHFPDSRIRDLTDYNRFIPKSANVKILGGQGNLRGTLTLLEDTGHANMELEGSNVELDISGARIRTDLKFVTNLADGNYGKKSYNLTGTYFRMENTRLATDNETTKDGWWGEVRIEKGDLIWTEPMDIDAQMHVKMRDTEPLIALLGNTKKKKSLLDKILTIKNVEGTLGIQTNETDIILDPVLIKGEGLQVISKLDLLEKSINGVLYVKLLGIAANFEIKDSKAKFKGLGGKNKVKKQVGVKAGNGIKTGKRPPRRNPHGAAAISKNTQ